MQFKVIDSKMKEIYFNAVPIEEPDDICESRDLFWKSLNSIAVQNITNVQYVKMA